MNTINTQVQEAITKPQGVSQKHTSLRTGSDKRKNPIQST